MDLLRGRFGSFGRADEEPEYDYDDEEIEDEVPPSPVGQDERRMQVRAYNHWAGLLGDRNFPAIEDLEPENLPDFGPNSVLLEFTDGVENPTVHFLGERLAEECGADTAIECLEDVPSLSLLSRITDHYMQILANQAPIGFEAEFINQRDKEVLYRGILLPFSSDNETIDFIFGVINWKELADSKTADELLLEIDQALASGGLGDADDAAEEEPEVLDLEPSAMLDADPSDEEDEAVGDHPVYRQPVFDEEADLSVEEFEEGEDDSEGPLPSLMGISINGEGRRKATALLAPVEDDGENEREGETSEIETPMPTEYAPEPVAFEGEMGGFDETERAHETARRDSPDDELESIDTEQRDDALSNDVMNTTEDGATDDGHDEPLDMNEGHDLSDNSAEPHEDSEPEGLYDVLAAARELADAARASEDRSRATLYKAVGSAYDLSLEAAADPQEFAELLADSGLAAQERAPMVPVVKLVFGEHYDKTRLTEYATVLAHAHRLNLERGSVGQFLRTAEGGLKGVVKAERDLRRQERGEPAKGARALQAKLAEALRAIDPVTLDDLDFGGPEFALVLVRRTPEGEKQVLGEVPEDVPLIEKAARKLVA